MDAPREGSPTPSRNVEIKARVHDLEALHRAVAAIADTGPTRLEQRDVFFVTPRGRLKLRTAAGRTPELIYYERPDQKSPAASHFQRVQCPDGPGLEAALTAALGQLGEVVKSRDLFRIGRTRVHLDRVEGLGDFVELEVVLEPGEDEARGRAEAEELMDRLAIGSADCLAVAYLDLLLRREA